MYLLRISVKHRNILKLNTMPTPSHDLFTSFVDSVQEIAVSTVNALCEAQNVTIRVNCGSFTILSKYGLSVKCPFKGPWMSCQDLSTCERHPKKKVGFSKKLLGPFHSRNERKISDIKECRWVFTNMGVYLIVAMIGIA